MKYNFFGEDAVFDHIGIAVEGVQDPDKIEDPENGVNVAFTDLHGINVEFVEPYCELHFSPIRSILQRGIRVYHICFRVWDMEKALKTARENGFHLIRPLQSAKAFEGKRIAWVFSNTYGLFELVELAVPVTQQQQIS